MSVAEWSEAAISRFLLWDLEHGYQVHAVGHLKGLGSEQEGFSYLRASARRTVSSSMKRACSPSQAVKTTIMTRSFASAKCDWRAPGRHQTSPKRSAFSEVASSCRLQ